MMLPHPHVVPLTRVVILGIALGLGGVSGSAVADDSSLETDLLKRLESNSRDGNAWRMLGRIRLRQGDDEGALRAFEQATLLLPQSAAAHFDKGRTLLRLGKKKDGKEAILKAIEISPESDYARDGRSLLGEPNGIKQAGYEVRPFAEPEPVDLLLPKNESLFEKRSRGPRIHELHLQIGSQYNTNVLLAPLSRSLSNTQRESVQGLFSGDLSVSLWEGDGWRTGPLMRGIFNFNEGDLRAFNLQSYNGGWFAEVDRTPFGLPGFSRIEYSFTHDEFDGDTLGNQHSLSLVSSIFHDGNRTTIFHLSADYTNFAADGGLPSVTSQDGVLISTGAAHELLFEGSPIRLFRFGFDLETVQARGSDFTYYGFNLFAEAVVPLGEKWDLVLSGGAGMRFYPDFEFDPPRDEILWRTGIELRRRLCAGVSLVGFVRYERFASQNPLFDAERFLGGALVELTW